MSGPSSYFTYKYQDETTRPKPLGVFDISGTPEHLPFYGGGYV